MVQFTRYHHLFDTHQCRQRNHGVVATAHENMFNVIRRIAARRRGLHHHVVLVTFSLVAGDLSATHHGLDCAGNIIDWHAHVGSAFTVYVHADFWFIQTQIRVHTHNARVLCNFFLEGTHHLRKVLVTVGGDDHKIQRTVTKWLA